MGKVSNNRACAVVWLSIVGLCGAMNAQAATDDADDMDTNNMPVKVQMFAPAKGDHVGIGGRGWFVDLAIQYPTTLDNTGFSGFQLTGPAVHNNVAPFPGTFSAGADDRLPGLIVLASTTTLGVGGCQNIANLFNLTGVTNTSATGVELWDTWIVGGPFFGVDTPSKIYVAVAADLNGDGIYNDAPGVVPDVNGDGMCSAADLKALGVASNIVKTHFYINP